MEENVMLRREGTRSNKSEETQNVGEEMNLEKKNLSAQTTGYSHGKLAMSARQHVYGGVCVCVFVCEMKRQKKGKWKGIKA